MSDGEFYVGYQSEAPPRLARFMRPLAMVLVVGGCALASVIALAQSPFVPSVFEYGVERSYSGVLSLKPYPVLFERGRAHVLFGAGKHGFTTSVPAGSSIVLRGSAVSLGMSRGIEVIPESVRRDTDTPTMPEPINMGRATLVGEIVDSKCYFGVMNPGRGKVHRDCAVRCISGGLPPALLVRDETGAVTPILLSGVSKEHLLPYVAEHVRVSGELIRQGTLVVLNVTAGSLARE